MLVFISPQSPGCLPSHTLHLGAITQLSAASGGPPALSPDSPLGHLHGCFSAALSGPQNNVCSPTTGNKQPCYTASYSHHDLVVVPRSASVTEYSELVHNSFCIPSLSLLTCGSFFLPCHEPEHVGSNWIRRPFPVCEAAFI